VASWAAGAAAESATTVHCPPRRISSRAGLARNCWHRHVLVNYRISARPTSSPSRSSSDCSTPRPPCIIKGRGEAVGDAETRRAIGSVAPSHTRTRKHTGSRSIESDLRASNNRNWMRKRRTRWIIRLKDKTSA
jgi:hypothetical protein